MRSPSYETLIGDALTEGFCGVVDRMSRRFEEPGRRIDIDVGDLLEDTAREVAARMAEYVIESYVISDEMRDPCPHCGTYLATYPLGKLAARLAAEDPAGRRRVGRLRGTDGARRAADKLTRRARRFNHRMTRPVEGPTEASA
jgi:hypothetical protein